MYKGFPNAAVLLEALRGEDQVRRNAALDALFGDGILRKNAIAHVGGHGGSRKDGEDVFQEAFCAFYRRIRQGAYRGEGKPEAYFMGIVRWEWFNERKRRKPDTGPYEGELESMMNEDNPESDLLNKDRRACFQKYLDQLKDKCRDLLKWYSLDYSMEEIARLKGYSSSEGAKKEVHLCRKRLRDLLEQHPEDWQDLFNRE